MEKKGTMFYAVLLPILDALHWQGSYSKIYQYLAEDETNMGLEGLLETLYNLNFRYRLLDRKFKGKQLTSPFLPVLVLEKEELYVVLTIENQSAVIYNGRTRQYEQRLLKKIKGTAFSFEIIEINHEEAKAGKDHWFQNLILNYKKPIIEIFTLTLFISLLNLMIPLFIALIYTFIFSGGNHKEMIILLLGIILYFAAELSFGAIRQKRLDDMSVHIGSAIDEQLYQHLLYLSPRYTENISVTKQLNRLRKFNHLKYFLTSGTFIRSIEASFLFIYIIAIFIFGRELGLVAMITTLLILFLGITARPLYRMYVDKTQSSWKAHQSNLVEIMKKRQEIQLLRKMDFWLGRSQSLSGKYIYIQYEQSDYVYFLNSLTHLICNGSGLILVYMGILKVFSNDLSVGTLIGIVLLYWKILEVLRGSFGLSLQWEDTKKTIRQIDQFMKIADDYHLGASQRLSKALKGKIVFQDVSMRYNKNSKPALLGIKFDINPGQIFGITGHGSAGKTTILKLILGMYVPQGGRILLDGINSKQRAPILLRESIGYLPEHIEIFEMTVRNNISCFNPRATDEQINEVIKKTTLDHYLKQYGLDLDTLLTPEIIKSLPPVLTQFLGLTRLLIRETKIYLLDEVENHLDQNELSIVIDLIRELSIEKKASVILVTKNKELLSQCHEYITLNQGRIYKKVRQEGEKE